MATATKTKTQTTLKFMDTYCVVLFDDNVTTIELVLDMLMDVLGYDEDDAFDLVMEIQENGKTVIKNRLTKDKAEEIKSKLLEYANTHPDPSSIEMLVAKEL